MAPRVAQIARTTRTKAAPAEASLAAEPRLRDSDLFVILLAVCTGMLAGLGVMLMDDLLVLLHGYISDLPNAISVTRPTCPVPCIDHADGRRNPRRRRHGGVAALATARGCHAIEADALFGGRMELVDSLGLAGVT